MRISTLIIISLLLSLITIPVSAYLSDINFDYELNKCSRLSSSESNYDFDIKLETNANYNSRCYYLRHHPLAYPSEMFLGIVLGMMLIVVPILFISWIINILRESGVV